jgi:uncharacterized protein YeeX (DUF496 family)
MLYDVFQWDDPEGFNTNYTCYLKYKNDILKTSGCEYRIREYEYWDRQISLIESNAKYISKKHCIDVCNKIIERMTESFGKTIDWNYVRRRYKELEKEWANL